MVILICVVVVLSLTTAAANPCSNGEMIEGAALKCTATQLLNLLQAKTTEQKCGIVLDTIRPCIIAAIARDHNKTCTAKEKHELIMNFRDSIKQHLQFDVIQCLPVMNCTDFESVMYYLQVSCETQFRKFLNLSTCRNLCDVATCHSGALVTQNITCSVEEFQNTIQTNITAWEAETGVRQTDICCGSSSGYLTTGSVGIFLSVVIFAVVILL